MTDERVQSTVSYDKKNMDLGYGHDNYVVRPDAPDLLWIEGKFGPVFMPHAEIPSSCGSMWVVCLRPMSHKSPPQRLPISTQNNTFAFHFHSINCIYFRVPEQNKQNSLPLDFFEQPLFVRGCTSGGKSQRGSPCPSEGRKYECCGES
jgi:hypothetical protein